MAKVIITIQDIDNGMVTIKAEPNMETMGKMLMDNGLTAAHSFAITAMNAIRNDARQDQDQKKTDSNLIL